jgi:hypothetical protein
MPKSGEQENKSERRAKYKAWLEENPETHRYWPETNGDGKKAILQALVSNLKGAGLLSKATGWRDVRLVPILNELHGIKEDA